MVLYSYSCLFLFFSGEICDEWSDDEDGPIIRVRWLYTASQVVVVVDRLVVVVC